MCVCVQGEEKSGEREREREKRAKRYTMRELPARVFLVKHIHTPYNAHLNVRSFGNGTHMENFAPYLPR